MANQGTDLSFMNGVPELLVLQLLSQNEMYGYEIVRAITDSTSQTINLGEGCVYPILHAMEKKGFLAARSLTRDGRKRIYYRLTDSGRGKLQLATHRWLELTRAINAVVGGPHVQNPAI